MNSLEGKLKYIENEIRYLRNDSPLSNEEKQEKINKLEQEKSEVESLIAFFDNGNKRIEELQKKDKLSKEEKKELKNLNESFDTKIKDYNKKSQGTYRDVLSAFFGQIDKRIHNIIYKNNSFWRSKNNRVNERYANVGKYLLKNGAISLLAYFGSGLVLGSLIPAAYPIVVAGVGAFFGQTVIKTVATIYNKVKYGGPRLTRKYSIEKNGYFNNIENCWGKFLNNKTLSKNEVRQIRKELVDKPDELRELTEEDLKPREEKNNGMLNLVSSMIASANIDTLSNSEVKKIIDLVEKNNLSDKLSNELRDKYLLIKSKLDKKDEKDDTLINSINIKLENLDVNTMSKEDSIKTVKFIDEHNLLNKLSDKARDKYNQLLEKVKEKVKEEEKEEKIEEVKKEKTDEVKDEVDDKVVLNNIIKDFDYSKFTIYNYENLFKYVSDNDLAKELLGVNKKKYQQLKVIYNAMIKIRDFDLEKFDINIANEIKNYVTNNKITKKLNNESYNKYQEIIKKLKLINNKENKDDSKKIVKDSDKIMAMRGFVDVLQELPRNIVECDINQLLLVINYIKDNNLEEECRDYLTRFEQEYNNRTKEKENIEDNIDPRVLEFARYYIKYPVKIRRTMPNNLKQIAILAKRIREGVASEDENRAYLMLCQREVSRNYSSDSVEIDDSIIGSEGKKAK